MSGARVRPPAYGPAVRSAFGAVLAVALVAGGIFALQKLVPPERDSPAVVADPNDTFTLPPASPTRAAPPTPTPSPSATPEPSPSATPPATAAPVPSPTAAARPAITVLNNSRVSGLAAKAARDFQRGGWRIAGTGNLRGRTPQTTVYYSPGQQAAAAELRRQFPAVKAMAPRYAGLPGAGGLTVVVTRDYPH